MRGRRMRYGVCLKEGGMSGSRGGGGGGGARRFVNISKRFDPGAGAAAAQGRSHRLVLFASKVNGFHKHRILM